MMIAVPTGNKKNVDGPQVKPIERTLANVGKVEW